MRTRVPCMASLHMSIILERVLLGYIYPKPGSYVIVNVKTQVI